MASREAEALRTETVHRLLNIFLPPGGSYRWGDGDPVINGVFLESSDTVCVDSYRRQWRGGDELKQVRRRIVIQVRIEETDLDE